MDFSSSLVVVLRNNLATVTVLLKLLDYYNFSIIIIIDNYCIVKPKQFNRQRNNRYLNDVQCFL